jgi:hypothetical protein
MVFILRKKFVLMVTILLLSIASYAQPGPGGPRGGGPGGGEPVPITGIEILLTAGGLLGIKRLLQKKK